MNINKFYFALFGFLLVLLIADNVFAVQPQTIGIAGRLTSAAGAILTGNYNLTFNIYNAQTGGSPLWTEIHDGRAAAPKVSLRSSVFSTILGNNTSLALPWNETYYLEMIVEGETLSPRVVFSSVPFTLNSTNPGRFNFTDAVTFDSTSIVHFKGNANISITPNNISTGTLSSAITFSGQNTFSGVTKFTGGVNISSTSADALNVTNGTIRTLNVDGSTNRVLISSATSDSLNVTDAATNTRVFDISSLGHTVRISGAQPDAFNVSNVTHRIFAVDASSPTGTPIVQVIGTPQSTVAFRVGTGGSGAGLLDIDTSANKINILPQGAIFIGTVNMSQSSPIFWNTSATPTLGGFVQTGTLTATCSLGDGTGGATTVNLGKAYTGANTYSVTYSIQNVASNPIVTGNTSALIGSSSQFSVYCNATVSQSPTIYWMTIGY